MGNEETRPIDRRTMLRMIGVAAGGSAMYRAMAGLGYAANSTYTGPIKLDGLSKPVSVLVLGAGLAGLTSALELTKAGYKVQLLEYNDRPGGRNWSLYGGDTYTELGGAVQKVEFDKGLYLNPGPWRIPYHHHAILTYCRQLNVALEPFIQVNHNAYVHSSTAFGGQKHRFRHVQADFNGSIAELLAKAAHQKKLDLPVTEEDTEVLLEAMRLWGALDKNYEYRQSGLTSERRGYDVDPGGGVQGWPTTSKPIEPLDLLKSGLWKSIIGSASYDFQTTLFQPVGGMGMISKAFARQLDPTIIRYNSKVTAIKQGEQGVTVKYRDTKTGDSILEAHADYCICTIPLPVLNQIDADVGAPMKNAIDALASYVSSIKTGLQFKRRFWEQDEDIYGGISYTDLSIGQIGYPNTNYGTNGKGILLGAYQFGNASVEDTSLTPDERVRKAVLEGAQIHPQYKAEFETGVSVAWHRVPFTLGCLSNWSDESRKEHYDNLVAFDGRIILAGEHASGLVWQEGAILSALDAIKRLHQRVMSA